MKLAYGTYGMPDRPPLEAVAAAADLGYEAVELAVLPGAPAAPESLDGPARRQLRSLLASGAIELCSLMLALDAFAADQATQVDRLRAACELAWHLAVETPPVLVSTLGGRPAQWQSDYKRLTDVLWGYLEQVEEAGLTLAIEPHVGGAMHLPEHALALVDELDSPRLKVNYDESHFRLQGLRPEQSAPLLAPHAVSAHLKDAVGDAESYEFRLPGDGDTDYPALLRLLAELGYNGPLTVEVSAQLWRAPGYDAMAAARRAYAVLAAARAEALSR